MSTSVSRKGAVYAEGEIEVVLSMAPTVENVRNLSKLLRRSPGAITIIFRVAYGYGGRFAETARSQRRKIYAAARRVGLVIGRRH